MSRPPFLLLLSKESVSLPEQEVDDIGLLRAKIPTLIGHRSLSAYSIHPSIQTEELVCPFFHGNRERERQLIKDRQTQKKNSHEIERASEREREACGPRRSRKKISYPLSFFSRLVPSFLTHSVHTRRQEDDQVVVVVDHREVHIFSFLFFFSFSPMMIQPTPEIRLHKRKPLK